MRQKSITKICGVCKKPFKVWPSHVTAGRGKFCGSTCYGIQKRKTEDEIVAEFGRTKTTDTGCWEWTGKRFGNGYARLCTGPKTVRAHRYAYELFKGEIPKGKQVLHHCDNKLCVNPEHLFLGTHQDNMDDKVKKNRQAVGEATKCATLFALDILTIRRLLADSHKQSEIGKVFGVHKGTISKIKNGKTWKHIP